jgi:hypothetical protein
VTAPVRRQPYPWRVEDLLRWYGLLLVSLVGLSVAWWGISGTASLARGITWLNVAVLCVVASGLANMRWLLQGRRAVAARRRNDLIDLLSLRRSSVEPGPADDVRVTVAGTRRYHHPHCQAVAGKPVQPGGVADHEQAGRVPCGLCAS